jgi:hypothetical protein
VATGQGRPSQSARESERGGAGPGEDGEAVVERRKIRRWRSRTGAFKSAIGVRGWELSIGNWCLRAAIERHAFDAANLQQKMQKY